ncbi:MAG: FimB/Mfa2 family fimbrial subunit [Bacteroidaceae bacterium]|nr:FimB/Mfa2 family fimbrial subunit [Bacteroidaceae bacterium]
MLKRYSYILVLLTMYLFSSCGAIMDDAQCDVSGGVPKMVRFKLSMQTPINETRAESWGGAYDSNSGIQYDNHIRPEGIVVEVRNTNNQLIGTVNSLMWWLDSSSQAPHSYNVLGDISHLSLNVNTAYKFIVIVNAQSYNSDIDNMTFSLDYITYPNGFIPMAGIKSHTFTAEENQEIGTIDLLRSVAKIEVAIDGNLVNQGYRLTSVTIDQYNGTGNLMPNGWRDVTNTKELHRDNCFNYNSDHKESSKGLPFAVQDSNKSFMLYYPEYNTTRYVAESMPKIAVVLDNGVGTAELSFPQAIAFGSYDSDGILIPNSYYDIVRNHIYSYTITGISHGLTLEYEVAEWKNGDVWDRGTIGYPTYHNPVLPDYIYSSSDRMQKIQESPVMRYTSDETLKESNAFSVWFNMTNPIGQKWVPTIKGHKEDFDIVVYRDYNGIMTRITDANDYVASEYWYNIKVIPKNPALDGEKFEFGITCTTDWSPGVNSSVYLLINGEQNNIAWPESGNSPQLIEIKQIND